MRPISTPPRLMILFLASLLLWSLFPAHAPAQKLKSAGHKSSNQAKAKPTPIARKVDTSASKEPKIKEQETTLPSGTCTAGTVRVNNLANIEALINMLADALQFGSFLTAGILLFRLNKAKSSKYALIKIAVIVVAGMAAPTLIHFAVSFTRDANLFV